jgi:O-antigen ligase
VVVAAGLGFAAIFHSVAPRTHWFASDLPYQQAQAKAKGPLPKDSGLSTYSIGEPSFRSHLNSLRDGIKTVAKHPQGYGLGNAGTTAQRFHVRLEAGESNYTELGVETGLAGALAFIAWSLALLAGLVRAAWSGDRAAAAIAAALAAVLALAIQSDVIGVPWLAYCLWWLAGSLAYANVLTKQLPASSHSNGLSATASRSA